MTVVEARAGGRAYPVHVGPGLLGRAGELVREALGERRVMVLHDPGAAAHLAPLLAALGPLALGDVALPRGEAAKTLEVAGSLWGALARAGLDRGDAVLALGGGAVLDAAGFVAATYHRGVPTVLVPTTVLAQADAAVGGKVAIDHPLAKNLVGAFHAPHLVLADTATLATLPDRERLSGLAEVVKAALIGDPDLLAVIERDLEALGRGTAPTLAEAIGRAVVVKARIVSLDEREGGPRLLLNLGHTVGHALEAACGFGPLLHGEAVVLGLHAATWVSRELGLPALEADRIRALLARFPLPAIDAPPRDRVIAAAARDKKRSAGRQRFVVLRSIGDAAVVEVDAPLLARAVDEALAVLGRAP